MRRFVLHKHSGQGRTHYDLMIQAGPALATWQFETDPSGLVFGGGPSPGPGLSDPGSGGAGQSMTDSGGAGSAASPASLSCRRIADHRAAYLDYEGPVSRGRGQVRAVARGQVQVLVESADQWDIALMPAADQRLRLTRQADNRWLLTGPH